MQRLLPILLIITVFGCGPKTTTTSTTSTGGKYSEDLSTWRPKETPADSVKKPVTAPRTDGQNNHQKKVEPKLAVNRELDLVLDSISEYNLANGSVDGFTIQVYSGIKREEALNAKKALSTSLPGFDAEVQYVQPNFRVRSGKYYDRLEAQKDYLTIKKYFPDAIVIPDRIPIN